MADRREFIGYIGTGAIGSIVGYYVGAQKLLGIQSEQTSRRNPEGLTEEPTEEPTQTRTSQAVAGQYTTFQYDTQNTGYTSTGPETVQSLTELWTFDIEGEPSGAPIVADGRIYIGSRNGRLYAIEATSGEIRWQESVGQVNSSPTIAGGNISVGAGGDVYLLNKDSGNEQWRSQIGRSAVSQTIVDGTVYSSRSGFGQVVALDFDSGNIEWRYNARGDYIGSNIESAPAVTEDLVIVGENSSFITAVDRQNGSAVWSYDTGPDGVRDLNNNPGSRVKGDPSIHDGAVYAAATEAGVYRLNLADGVEQWRFNPDTPVTTSPAVVDDRVFIGSFGGKLYALNTASGTVAWEFTAASGIRSSPVVTPRLVVFGTDAGKIHILTRSSGEQLLEYSIDAKIEAPIVVLEEVLLTASQSGTVYALQIQ